MRRSPAFERSAAPVTGRHVPENRRMAEPASRTTCIAANEAAVQLPPGLRWRAVERGWRVGLNLPLPGPADRLRPPAARPKFDGAESASPPIADIPAAALDFRF